MINYGKETEERIAKQRADIKRENKFVETHILENKEGKVIYEGPVANRIYEIMTKKVGDYRSYSFTKMKGDYLRVDAVEWYVFDDDNTKKLLECDTKTIHLSGKDILNGLELLLKKSSGETK